MPNFIRISRVARPTKSDKTQRTIFLRVFPSWENGRDFTFSTKITIPENRWNKITKSVSGTGIDSNRLNTQLSQLEVETQNIFQRYINVVANPNMKDLKSEIEFKLFNKGSGKSKEMFVSDLFDRYIDLHRSDLCEKRIERYTFVKSSVDDFHIQRFGKQNVGLEVLNREWRDEYKQFMMSRFKYKTSTINGYLKVLHAAVRYAYHTNHIEKFPFKDCKFEKVEQTIKYLTDEEYLSIANFDFSKADERIQRTADCFLFACNTGLAISDLRSFNKSNLERDKDGSLSIVKYRDKTKVRFLVPLNNLALSIIEKYRLHQDIVGTDLLLPVIHINDFNHLLKMIALMCGVNKNLTSHVARHTFATTNWLNNGGTLESLQSMLGHSKIQTTEIYGQITDEKVKSEASLVFSNQAKKGA